MQPQDPGKDELELQEQKLAQTHAHHGRIDGKILNLGSTGSY